MEAAPLVSHHPIRIGMLGLSPGNGHPYSWSAIFNGYDRERMARECPYAGIPGYLGKEPETSFGIGDATVTHICCTGAGDFTAESVAACSRIRHVVPRPEELFGEVDAVIIATDDGADHVDRARPFVEAGIPIFIDKPLADNVADLAIFSGWVGAGAPIMSSSALRYSKEFSPYRASTHDLGELRFASITHIKRWETYGIHALEAVYPILGPGFLTCANTGTADRNVCHFTHRSGVDVVVVISMDMTGGYGLLTLAGTEKSVQTRNSDTFYAFKAQLAAFVGYLETGVRPFPFSETEELIRMVIAGTESRERGGKRVDIAEIGI
jgi:hypothetical protein